MSNFEFYITIIWELWNHRNNVVLGKKTWNQPELVQWTGSFLEEFRDANKTTVRREEERPTKPRWMPPMQGTISVTVDAALDRDQGGFGVGCIARDHTGRVLASQTFSQAWGFTPQLAEAFAVLQGVVLASSIGGSRLELHSDCSEVVKAVAGGEIPTTELGTILQRIKREVRNLIEFKILHIPRLCNIAAHNLARFAVTHRSNSRWMALVPPCSEEAIRADDREIQSHLSG